MSDYGFCQHGFKWFATAGGRRVGEGFRYPQETSSEVLAELDG